MTPRRMTPGHVALAVLVATIWGIAFVVSKVGLESFTPSQLTALRFIVASVAVFWLPRPAIAWSMLIWIGLTLFTGQFLLQFFGIAWGVPPGLTAVLVQTQALFTVVFASLILGERPTGPQIFGMVVAIAGLGLIGLTLGRGVPVVAFLLTLGSALSWAAGNILVKQTKSVDRLSLIVWASLVPPIPALAISATLDGPMSMAHAIANASWSSISAVIFLGVLATVIGYAAWASLLAKYSAAAVAPFALLAPCVAAITSSLVFGEQFEPARLAGMATMLVGVLITLLPPEWVGTKRREPG